MTRYNVVTPGNPHPHCATNDFAVAQLAKAAHPGSILVAHRAVYNLDTGQWGVPPQRSRQQAQAWPRGTVWRP